ncbi:U3 small nucleolar RNA-associated protein 14 B, partial [Calypte anna]
GEKLVLSELLQPIRPKSALGRVRKELNRVKQKKAVELPLSKEEAQRVVREAAYVGTSKEVGRWQEVVLQHRRAEQMVFPLQQDIPTVVPLEQTASAWKARTPLEQEIFGLLHQTQQPTTDPLLTPQEVASLQAMSLEEARRRRAELQRARALQSYYEAKARREKRIKSKKYHRVLKRSRRRQALKEFELLQKSDPEAALARLEELEQLRMQERMSLKHQNKGKWARSRAIVAKYDLEARKAMQEQLAKNKELTQKVHVELPQEEPGDPPGEDLTPVTVPTVPSGAGTANPWMLGQPSHPAEGQEGLGEAMVPGADEAEAVSELAGDSLVPPVPAKELTSAGVEQSSRAQEQILLSGQLSRVQTVEDMEALASEERVEEQEQQEKRVEEEPGEQQEKPGGRPAKKPPAKRKMISLEAVMSGKLQELQCPVLPVVVEEEEGGIDQRGVITEAFAGDDVVADFQREKLKAEQAGKPQPLNLVLPGWGEWGGTGLKPSAKKVKRFLLKPPPAPPRKDRHLPNVILSEKRNIHAAAHQVSELPFPFERHQHFEQSICTPLGTTWNTQRAFQKLTAPRVITRAGHIIQPISAEDV